MFFCQAVDVSRVSDSITPNGKGLALWRHLKYVSRQLKPNKELKYKIYSVAWRCSSSWNYCRIMNKCSWLVRRPAITSNRMLCVRSLSRHCRDAINLSVNIDSKSSKESLSPFEVMLRGVPYIL